MLSSIGRIIPGRTPDVAGMPGGSLLNLLTCSGSLIPSLKQFQIEIV
jgi:hypothetical protein